jgi:hypothetical protein
MKMQIAASRRERAEHELERHARAAEPEK